MKKRYKIFLVDDHKIFREALTFRISQMRGFRVVGEASSGNAFLDMLDGLDIDIVLLDISMPGIDGIITAARALEKRPDLRIIMLTMFSDEEYYYRMIQTGVMGYIPKELGSDELELALNTVISGKSYFPKISPSHHSVLAYQKNHSSGRQLT
jgi:DNA-binding NarL/FixJ family response regulator